MWVTLLTGGPRAVAQGPVTAGPGGWWLLGAASGPQLWLLSPEGREETRAAPSVGRGLGLPGRDGAP